MIKLFKPPWLADQATRLYESFNLKSPKSKHTPSEFLYWSNHFHSGDIYRTLRKDFTHAYNNPLSFSNFYYSWAFSMPSPTTFLFNFLKYQTLTMRPQKKSILLIYLGSQALPVPTKRHVWLECPTVKDSFLGKGKGTHYGSLLFDVSSKSSSNEVPLCYHSHMTQFSIVTMGRAS